MPLQVYLESIGCKLNQCERDALATQFAETGYVVVPCPEGADLCIVNTCAVTHVAARKSRQRFRHLRRINPSARLVATGCYAEIGQNDLETDLIVANDEKGELLARVEARLASWELRDRGSQHSATLSSPVVRRTRPMVKIQDGCDNACAFCIVHILRGPQRSVPQTQILAQVADLVQSGYHEVVLTGVHVGAYGSERNGSLLDLVRAILAECPPERLRLSSIEPWDLTPEFFAMWDDSRLCRHLHLPLQSGCDATLKRMNRRHTTQLYANLADDARRAIPGLALTTDLIVGFPGETDPEFASSAAFVERMGFARVHVFPYSSRPGTPAATMPDQVEPQVRHRRARDMRTIAQRSSEAFRQQLVGLTLPVLWEGRPVHGRWSGLTDNYVRVFAESSENLANTLRPAHLSALDPGGLRGKVLRCADARKEENHGT